MYISFNVVQQLSLILYQNYKKCTNTYLGRIRYNLTTPVLRSLYHLVPWQSFFFGYRHQHPKLVKGRCARMGLYRGCSLSYALMVDTQWPLRKEYIERVCGISGVSLFLIKITLKDETVFAQTNCSIVPI